MFNALSLEYLAPQQLQNLLLQVKGTHFSTLHLGQAYKAKPFLGSWHPMIFSTSSRIVLRIGLPCFFISAKKLCQLSLKYLFNFVFSSYFII
jgi:hypothetical protein